QGPGDRARRGSRHAPRRPRADWNLTVTSMTGQSPAKQPGQAEDANPPAAATVGRRRLLLGLGAAGGSALVGALATGRPAPAAPPDEASAEGALRPAVPSRGPHQAGIVTPRQQFGLVVAFDVLANSRPGLRHLLEALPGRIAFLTQGGPAPTADPGFP